GKHIIDTKETDNEPPFLTYTAVNQDGTLYGAVARIINENGTIEKTPIGIRVKESSKIIVLIEVFVKESLDNKDNILQQLKEKLLFVEKDYKVLLEESRLEHEKLYKSAELSFGYEEEYHCNEDLL